jgi:hypothetical protein
MPHEQMLMGKGKWFVSPYFLVIGYIISASAPKSFVS